MKKDNKIINETISKIYSINGRRKDKDGNEYIYKNFEVFVPYDYLQICNIDNHIYFYMDDIIYMTSVQPDGSVPSKKISVHKQRNPKKTEKPSEIDNTWKRFFIIPRKFFPNVSEDKKVRFTLDITEQDRFSAEPVLTMELINE